MRAFKHIIGMFAVLLATVCAHAQTDPQAGPDRVRGIEGRVAIYASTNAPREVLAWLPPDTVLTVYGALKEDVWVPVEAPAALNAWIYRDLVRGGCVAADKSRVRAGPDLTYPSVATLDKGDPVEIRGSYGDWLKIKPPAGLNFWVLRDQVEALASSATENDADSDPGRAAEGSAILAFTNILAEAQAGPAAQAVTPPPELVGFTLEDKPGQGRRATFTGVLDWGTVGSVQTPFCIIAKQADGDLLPACHLLAPEQTYSSHVGETITVEGTAWQVRNTELPVVIPLSIRIGGPAPRTADSGL